MQKGITLLIFSIFNFPLLAQFAPGAGQPGSTAIAADSNIIVAWASACTIERGPLNIEEPDGMLASLGEQENAIGPAGQNGLVSLGDGGTATLTFDFPIKNGPGWDFAIFENGFASGDGYFLELAFVEVSSDGVNYFRFPSTSLTDTMYQVDNFSTLDPTKINNLAGKYVTFYGTPFDLEELVDTEGLDLNQITHIRLIDVVGSLDDAYASRDSEANKINDPWPTAFESCGFDLDAVGVIHENSNTSTQEIFQSKYSVFPNPAKRGQILYISNAQDVKFRLFDQLGRLILEGQSSTIESQSLSSGFYYLMLESEIGIQSLSLSIID